MRRASRARKNSRHGRSRSSQRKSSTRRGKGTRNPGLRPRSTLRESVQTALERLAAGAAIVPLASHALQVPKVLSYWLIYRWLESGIIVPPFDNSFSEWFYSVGSYKKFLVYNVINDVLGAGVSSGNLGGRYSTYGIELWWYFVTPGTITTPLFPSVRRALHGGNGMRVWMDVVLFLLYLSSLIYAFAYADDKTDQQLNLFFPILIAGAALALFDVLPLLASRIEHQGYILLLALACPSENTFLNCARCVQISLYVFSGICKMGPWFKHVTVGMALSSPWSQFINRIVKGRSDTVLGAATTLFKDKTWQPTTLVAAVSWAGCLFEFVMGPGCLLFPEYFVFPTLGFHCYIIGMLPLASVTEWNIFTMITTWRLFMQNKFDYQTAYDFYVVMSDHHNLMNFLFDPAEDSTTSLSRVLLLSCLVFCLLIVPVIGNIWPVKVPFLLAYRPYTGNWRFSFVAYKKKAQRKLNQLTTYGGSMDEEVLAERWLTRWSPGGAISGAQWKEYLLATAMLWPSYRPMLSAMDFLEKESPAEDEWTVTFGVIFGNLVHGWNFGYGWILCQPSTRLCIQERCRFKEGECFHIQIDPMHFYSRNLHWRCVDMATGENVIEEIVRYDQLESLKKPWDKYKPLHRKVRGRSQKL